MALLIKDVLEDMMMDIIQRHLCGFLSLMFLMEVLK